MSKMHAREGFCFERLEDGSVRISKVLAGQVGSEVDPNAARCEITAYAATIPPNEWASVVAHVSQHGDNGDTWRVVLDLHGDPQK